ncbi:RES family NAD+ phosphorylase [Tabrizicola sp.]|uniref:RES family NAD+ phosphorylase n=1 Tax=Tabrizicola sp. TaxID=2005166 RepID=UPI001A3CEF83|nr:RES family NAD+ phosphorylase [Tabrizicola sp.]MBL9063975.1 RES family NAD+ phosphorylase [Tabrizicola sp.]
MPFLALDGLFYRIVPTARAAHALAPATSPEGRFHHDAQPSLCASSRPDWAEHAIAPYVRDDDPPRVICELRLTGVRVLDLRNPDHCARCGINPALAAVPWLPERARDLPASTWAVSDRARASGADGMIYTARSEPTRWHLVLFRWPGAHLTGHVLPYPLPG